MKAIRVLVIAGLLLCLGTAAYIYSGLFPIGADEPHSRPVLWLITTLRDQAITHASRRIVVPPLDDPEMVRRGGPEYAEMCASCHLAPGVEKSELSQGLYPPPPNLVTSTTVDRGPRRQFWVIKHGIKTTSMPAWGVTHDDQRLWTIVAFLQRLPKLTPKQYQALTASDEARHEQRH